MTIIKALFVGLAAVWVCIAQDINISGIVTDIEGSPIAGAVVQLENGGLPTTTEADGSFTITGTVGINNQINQSIPHMLSVKVNNGLLYIIVAENSPAEIITYNLQGEVISAIQKTTRVGAHSIALPHRGAGVYLYKIKTGTNELIIKNAWLDRISSSAALSTDVLTTTESSILSKRYVPIKDVIAVAKDGYLNYRVIVTNSDTSNIEIKMIVCADTVIDIDGDVYQAVQIGNQVWTVENLRTTRYNDSTPIPHVTDISAWANDNSGAYCYYSNDSAANAVKYGAFYNWHALNTGKLAPAGWHVPTDAEWDILQNYLIANGYNWDGTTTGNKIGKSLAAKTDWTSLNREGVVGNDLSSNNICGFSALPGGWRDFNGFYSNVGANGIWWSATESDTSQAFYRYLFYIEDNLGRSYSLKESGHSVRLVRD